MTGQRRVPGGCGDDKILHRDLQKVTRDCVEVGRVFGNEVAKLAVNGGLGVPGTESVDGSVVVEVLAVEPN